MTMEKNEANISSDEYRENLLKEYQEKCMPHCTVCGSDNTAEVNCGLAGTSIYLATRTQKFHLRANGKPAQYYCNACQQYFDIAVESDT